MTINEFASSKVQKLNVLFGMHDLCPQLFSYKHQILRWVPIRTPYRVTTFSGFHSGILYHAPTSRHFMDPTGTYCMCRCSDQKGSSNEKTARPTMLVAWWGQNSPRLIFTWHTAHSFFFYSVLKAVHCQNVCHYSFPQKVLLFDKRRFMSHSFSN